MSLYPNTMIGRISISFFIVLVVTKICNGASVQKMPNSETFGSQEVASCQGSSRWVHTRDTETTHGIDRLSNSPELDDNLSDTESSLEKIFKRATNNKTASNWPHDIPYIISSSYTGSVPRLQRVMRHISNHVCINFHDVTHTYNKSIPNWGTSHGFQTNSHVLVKTNTGCNANIGRGTSPGARVVSPCNDFLTNIHEMFHIVGVVHEQSGKGREAYITLHFDNILPKMAYTYKEHTDQYIVVNDFDIRSAMLYWDYGYNSNGLETYTSIRDDFDWYIMGVSSESNIFSELNAIYRCNKDFCQDNKTNCGLGYFAFVYGACRCVCPYNLDPDTNCQQLVNQSARISWPKTPIALLGADGCPEGFNPTPGVLPVKGYNDPYLGTSPYPLPTDGHTLELPVCTKTTPEASNETDWLSWPPGGYYCLLKHKGSNCGGAFVEGAFEIKTFGAVKSTGDIGDSEVHDDKVIMRFCCQTSDVETMVLDLPNSKPFRLFAYDVCPTVRGMSVAKSVVRIYTNHTVASGALPPKVFQARISSSFFQCLYIPPVYGCNQDVTLDSANPSVRITSPGSIAGREPNRRCFYRFQNPKNSRLLVTLHTFDLHPSDKLLVQRFHPFIDAYSLRNDKPQKYIISDTDYLSLEYFSSWETTTKQGIDFTVDVILEEDFCYNMTLKGEDYTGDKSVSETYEDCIPWEKATHCEDFPFDDPDILASGNKCRNPKGNLTHPWCYTFVGETGCHKRYCDVCNLKSPIDTLPNCSSLIQDDKSFCSSAIERFGCFKSCGLSIEKYEPRVDGCPKNWIYVGDRCFKLFSTNANYHDALLACQSFDAKSTLLEIKNITDEKLAIDLLWQTDSQKIWINGQSNSQWIQSVFSATSLGPEQCIQVGIDRGLQESWWAAVNCSSDATRASYFCQLDRFLSAAPITFNDSCHDVDVSVCETMLAAFPEYCTNARSKVAAAKDCQRSCGHCGAKAQCLPTNSSNYITKSSNQKVETGQVMEFTCQDGLYLVGGHLQRACSSSGQLLGQEPLCAEHPVTTDIKLESLRKRRSTLPAKTIYLMDNKDYKIPFKGNITKWYYFCSAAGNVAFLVYHKNGTGYNYFGSNTVNCVPGWRRTFNVPPTEQISVTEHHVIGVYSQTSGTIYVNDCNSASVKMSMLMKDTDRSFATLINSVKNFTSQYCTFPSLGYRIEPERK